MELKIGGKTYELHFGLAFLRELDKRHEIRAGDSPVKIGFGVGAVSIGLAQMNPTILADIIQAGTATEKSKPSLYEIEKFLEEYEDLESLFTRFLEQLRKAPLVACQLKRFEETAQQIDPEDL